MTVIAFQVQLFGAFTIYQNGTPLPLPASNDARRLLACLFLRRKPLPRAALIGQLRPESNEADARRALRQAVWHINRSLPGLLTTDPEQIALADPTSLQIDVVDFEELLKSEGPWSVTAQTLSRAVALYQGDLLEGYYDDWAIIERERLRELYLQALETLIVAFKATLRYEQALQTAQELARIDPLRESAHREIMRLHHYLGNSATALRQFEICRQVLQRELALEPDDETQKLARSIARHTSIKKESPVGSYLPDPRPTLIGRPGNNERTLSLPLIGRTAERAQLLQWLQQNESRNGHLIVLEGEAGIGKTRLLREVAADFEWRGGQLLWGKFSQLETGRPLEALTEALESGLTPLRTEQLQQLLEPVWRQVLYPLLPGLIDTPTQSTALPTLKSEAAQTRLIEGLARLLTAWAEITPLLLVLDDFHWADPDTLEIVLHLAVRLERAGIVLIVSLRTEELHTQPDLRQKLTDFPWSALLGHLNLGRLDEAAIEELVRTCLGGTLAPTFSLRLALETHGNPLFILEILHSLYDEGILRPTADGLWTTPYDLDMDTYELPLPPVVEQVILRRLEQLPSHLRDILERLSVLGGQFDFKLLAGLHWFDLPALLTALQEFLKRRLLVELPHTYQFRHDKIHQVIYEALTPERRRTLHLETAQALELQTPLPIEALAHHFSAGMEWKKAYHYQKLAAEKALTVFIYSQALQHLDLAIQAADQIDPQEAGQFELLSRREAVLEILGRREDQNRDLERLAHLACHDPRRLVQVRQRQAVLMEMLSRFAEGEQLARESLALAQQLGDPETEAMSWIILGEIINLAFDGRLDLAQECYWAAEKLCRDTQNLQLAGEVHMHLGWLKAQPDADLAIEENLKALAIYEQLGDKARMADIYCRLGSVYQNKEGGHQTVEKAYLNALTLARELGYAYVEARALNNLGNIYAEMHIEQALACYEEAGKIFWQLNDHRLAQVVWLNAAQCRLTALGEYEPIPPIIEKALDYLRQHEDAWVRGFVEIIEGLSSRQKQDYPTAHQRLNSAVVRLEALTARWLTGTAYQALAQLDYEMDELDEAWSHLQAAEKLARVENWKPSLVLILANQARICLKKKQWTEAGRLSGEALTDWSDSGTQPWWAPFVRYQALTALGQSDTARPFLEQAQKLLETMLDRLTPEHRRMSLQRRSEHREILAAWQECRPNRVRVTLLREAAPRETIEIEWTPNAPEDRTGTDKIARRRQQLARLLAEAASQGARPTYRALAAALQVSIRTIAQDLAALKKNDLYG